MMRPQFDGLRRRKVSEEQRRLSIRTIAYESGRLHGAVLQVASHSELLGYVHDTDNARNGPECWSPASGECSQ